MEARVLVGLATVLALVCMTQAEPILHNAGARGLKAVFEASGPTVFWIKSSETTGFNCSLTCRAARLQAVNGGPPKPVTQLCGITDGTSNTIVAGSTNPLAGDASCATALTDDPFTLDFYCGCLPGRPSWTWAPFGTQCESKGDFASAYLVDPVTQSTGFICRFKTDTETFIGFANSDGCQWFGGQADFSVTWDVLCVKPAFVYATSVPAV